MFFRVLSQSTKEEFKHIKAVSPITSFACRNLPKRNLNFDPEGKNDKERYESQSTKEEFKHFRV